MKETVEVLLDYFNHGWLKDSERDRFINIEHQKLMGCLDSMMGETRRYIIQRISDKKYFEYEVRAFTDRQSRWNSSNCKPVTATEVERKVEMVERVYYE